METKALTDFLQNCNSRTVPQSEMYNFIKHYTNDFDKTSFDYLRSDLNRYTDNIKFTMIVDTECDGSVDRHTTIYNYIEKQQEFLSLVLTPRQKIEFVLCDLKEKEINYYIFEDDYIYFFRFCDMVETEYKKLDSINSIIERTQKRFAGSKIIKIYDPIKVHKEFKKELKCDYNTFKAWFVDSIICDKQMSWNYDNENKTQLRSFIYTICGGWKPAETNTAFKISVDSNDRECKLNSNLLQRIEKCTFK